MCNCCEGGLAITSQYILDIPATIRITNGNELRADVGFNWVWGKINYCPVCGERLTDDKNEKQK